jgi:N-acetylglucosamine-6-phosphate deacetylase
MDRVIITDRRVITPWQVLEKGVVVVEGGRIAEIREGLEPSAEAGATITDATGRAVAPGYIDIHVHGGADQTPWTPSEGLDKSRTVEYNFTW